MSIPFIYRDRRAAMFDKTIAFAFRLSQIAVWVGGAMMLFAALMVSIDVITRQLFGLTIGGSDEISGYLFAIATALAMPYALLHRANVRIDALYKHFPSRVRTALDILSVSLLAFFAGAVTWRAALSLSVSWASSSRSITPLQVPLVLPQSLWFVGWLFFCLCLALVIYGMILAWLRGDLVRAQELGGARTIEEEVQEEVPAVRCTDHKADASTTMFVSACPLSRQKET